jgi:hypothetical protein
MAACERVAYFRGELRRNTERLAELGVALKVINGGAGQPDPTLLEAPRVRSRAALIPRTLERERSRSVLDVGCDDLASVAELPIADYMGIDIAETVIEANAGRHPAGSFCPKIS